MYDHIVVPVAPDHIGDYSTSTGCGSTSFVRGRKAVRAVRFGGTPLLRGIIFSVGSNQRNIVELKDAIETELGSEEIDVHVRSGHPTNTILEWRRTTTRTA